MGNLMNILCKGGDDDTKMMREQKLFLEGYRESTEHQSVKKKYATLKSEHSKAIEELKEITEKFTEQTSMIDQLKEALEEKKKDLEERVIELGSQNGKLEEMTHKVQLFDLMKENLELLEGKGKEAEILERKILELHQTQEQIMIRVKEIEDERDELIADNDSLESDIGILEVENEEMKKLLRKALNDRTMVKKKKEITIKNTPSSPGQIRN